MGGSPRNKLTNAMPRSERASGVTEQMKKLIITVIIVAAVSAVVTTLIFRVLGLNESAPIASGVAGGV